MSGVTITFPQSTIFNLTNPGLVLWLDGSYMSSSATATTSGPLGKQDAYRFTDVSVAVGLYSASLTDSLGNVQTQGYVNIETTTGSYEVKATREAALMTVNSDGTVNPNTTGTGLNTVTLSFTDGSQPLQNLTCTVVDSGMTAYTNQTNSSGQVVLSLNNGSYTVNGVKSGYQSFSTTLTVSANPTTPIAYVLTPLTITPSDPDESTGWLLCLDQDGNPEAGIAHTVTLVGAPNTTTGRSFSATEKSVNSDGDGLVTVTGHIPGLTYTVRRGDGHEATYVAESETFQMPSVVG